MAEHSEQLGNLEDEKKTLFDTKSEVKEEVGQFAPASLQTDREQDLNQHIQAAPVLVPVQQNTEEEIREAYRTMSGSGPGLIERNKAKKEYNKKRGAHHTAQNARMHVKNMKEQQADALMGNAWGQTESEGLFLDKSQHQDLAALENALAKFEEVDLAQFDLFKKTIREKGYAAIAGHQFIFGAAEQMEDNIKEYIRQGGYLSQKRVMKIREKALLLKSVKKAWDREAAIYENKGHLLLREKTVNGMSDTKLTEARDRTKDTDPELSAYFQAILDKRAAQKKQQAPDGALTDSDGDLLYREGMSIEELKAAVHQKFIAEEASRQIAFWQNFQQKMETTIKEDCTDGGLYGNETCRSVSSEMPLTGQLARPTTRTSLVFMNFLHEEGLSYDADLTEEQQQRLFAKRHEIDRIIDEDNTAENGAQVMRGALLGIIDQFKGTGFQRIAPPALDDPDFLRKFQKTTKLLTHIFDFYQMIEKCSPEVQQGTFQGISKQDLRLYMKINNFAQNVNLFMTRLAYSMTDRLLAKDNAEELLREGLMDPENSDLNVKPAFFYTEAYDDQAERVRKGQRDYPDSSQWQHNTVFSFSISAEASFSDYATALKKYENGDFRSTEESALMNESGTVITMGNQGRYDFSNNPE